MSFGIRDVCTKCGESWPMKEGPLWHEGCGGMVIFGDSTDIERARGKCAQVAYLDDGFPAVRCELPAGHAADHRDGGVTWI